MNLVIDRGNTFVKWAVFDGAQMVFKARSTGLSDDHIEGLFQTYPITAAISSAVAEMGFSIQNISNRVPYICLDHKTSVPFVNTYKTPETLGRDRIAAVSGAMMEWPHQNLLVIDTGTCLTIDFLDKTGLYLGGNISPGPELRYLAMHQHTASLPMVSRPSKMHYIGWDTETAMQNGGFAGCVSEIVGWMAYAREQFQEIIVVISGGDADAFATSMKNEIFTRPNLVLTGLNKILQFNG